MYGHPLSVVGQARAFAPSHRAFCRWYAHRAKQGVLPLEVGQTDK